MRKIEDIVNCGDDLVCIYFSDGTTLEIPAGLAMKAGFRVSMDLSDEALDNLIYEVDKNKCYNAAMHYLELRDRSEQEMRLHLSSKYKNSGAIIERTIARLKRNGFLDDRSFARLWVSDRVAHKPESRSLIKRELLQKGISKEIADEAIEGIDDAACAYLVGLKKARLMENLDYPTFARRLAAFLSRRGYNMETVRSTINRLWHEVSEKE